MIVVDASALANAFTDDGLLGQSARALLAQDDHWSAPEHLRVEVFSAVRGRRLGGKITDARAVEALDALEEATIEVLAVTPLLRRMWELRANLNAYDAAYVAAAEAHGCALLTADRRLARAPGIRCEVTVTHPA